MVSKLTTGTESSVKTRRDFITSSAAAACLGQVSRASAATPDRTEDAARVRSGGSLMIDVGEGHRVWTKHVGSTSGVQVLTLHGGPGLPHFYFECFEDFLPQAGFGYWYYDQLGCGFSDNPRDSSLWTIERYCEEVEAVRRGLKQEKLVLLGHSWGGILAIEYALKYPQHVRALVISNMSASIDSYLQHLDRLRKQLPQAQQTALSEFEARGDYSSPEYEQLMWGVLYHQHICRLDPWPEPVDRAVRFLNETIYSTMQGSDEFHVTGNLAGWDRM